MHSVIVVGYQTHSFAPTLVVGKIELLPFCVDLSRIEVLIFTSKNAVLSLKQSAKNFPSMQGWQSIPSYAIGQKTAQAIAENGGNVAYIHQDSHAQTLLAVLKQRLQGKKILYLRAKKIASNWDSLLQEQGMDLQTQIVYQSVFQPLPKEKAPKEGAILLFTSPSSYRFFLQNFSWKSSYRAVGIGRTTYASFAEGITKEISPFQDIQKSVEYLRQKLGLQG